MIQVHVNGSGVLLSPEEITSMLFEDLRHMVEIYLNGSIISHTTVISIPSYFSDDQALAMKLAAEVAGFNDVKYEREFASLCQSCRLHTWNLYGSSGCPALYYVSYDIGAKETEIMLHTIESDYSEFRTEHMITATDFGGEDVENSLLGYALSAFYDKYNIDMRNDPEGLEPLKRELERVQMTLLSEPFDTIKFVPTGAITPIAIPITKLQIEEWDKKLSDKVTNLLDQLFEGSSVIRKTKIEKVIVTGSPNYVSKIRPIVETYFDGTEILPSNTTDTENAILLGAAKNRWAFKYASYDMVSYCELVHLSLGVETSGNVFTTVIPRDIVAPVRRRITLSTAVDNQHSATIKILEGDRPVASENRVLGTVEIVDLPPKLKHQLGIEIEFQFSTSGLTVTATVPGHDTETRLHITRVGPCSVEERDNILSDANTHYEEDMKLLHEAEVDIPKREDELWARPKSGRTSITNTEDDF